MTILYATLIIGGIGLLFGVVLALASKYLEVKEDPRIDEVEKMLPGYNCGACGTPGCRGFATMIVSGEAGNLKRCKPGKVDANFNPILEYLKANPNPDGTPVNIKL
ncbi:MAG: (Fe-S)-binding protein [Acholeplasmatales bacterium]